MKIEVVDAIMQPDLEDPWDVFQDEDAFIWLDWKEWGDSIVQACEARLKTGKLWCEDSDDEDRPEFHVELGDRRSSFRVTKRGDNQTLTVCALNEVLAPDYELRYCTDSYGNDTSVFLPLKKSEWAAMEQRYGAALHKRFLPFGTDAELLSNYSDKPAPAQDSAPAAPPKPSMSAAPLKTSVRVLGVDPGPTPRKATLKQWMAMVSPLHYFFAFAIPIVGLLVIAVFSFSPFMGVRIGAAALVVGGTIAIWVAPLRCRKLARIGIPVLGDVTTYKVERGKMTLRCTYVIGEKRYNGVLYPADRPAGAKDVESRVWLVVDPNNPEFCGTWELMTPGAPKPAAAQSPASKPLTEAPKPTVQAKPPATPEKKPPANPVERPARLIDPVTVHKPSTAGIEQKQLVRAIKDMHKWCSVAPQRLVSGDTWEYLDRSEECMSTGSVGFTNAVYFVGLCMGKLGQLDVLSGHPEGWESIHRVSLYSYWGMRIGMRSLDAHHGQAPEGRRIGSRMLSNWALLYCYGIIAGMKQIEDSSADVLIELATDPTRVSPEEWAKRRFEPFVARLCLMDRQMAIPDDLANRSFGVYDGILQNWDQYDALAAPLREACDYHCWNLDRRSDDWEPEFEAAPYQLIPVEILAIRALRNRKGLTTPEIDHPLMKTPLADFSTRGAGVEDDIVRALRATLKKVHGES